MPNPYFQADVETGGLIGNYDPYSRDMYFAKKTTWTPYRESAKANKLWGDNLFDDEQMKIWI